MTGLGLLKKSRETMATARSPGQPLGCRISAWHEIIGKPGGQDDAQDSLSRHRFVRFGQNAEPC